MSNWKDHINPVMALEAWAEENYPDIWDEWQTHFVDEDTEFGAWLEREYFVASDEWRKEWKDYSMLRKAWRSKTNSENEQPGAPDRLAILQAENSALADSLYGVVERLQMLQAKPDAAPVVGELTEALSALDRATAKLTMRERVRR